VCAQAHAKRKAAVAELEEVEAQALLEESLAEERKEWQKKERLAVGKGMREGTGWQKELEDLRAAKTDGIRWQESTAVMAGAWSGMAEVVVKRKEEEEKTRSPEPTADEAARRRADEPPMKKVRMFLAPCKVCKKCQTPCLEDTDTCETCQKLEWLKRCRKVRKLGIIKESEEDLKERLENDRFMQEMFQNEDWKEDLSDANEWKKISEKQWLIALKKPLDEDMRKLYLTIPEETQMRLYDNCTDIMINDIKQALVCKRHNGPLLPSHCWLADRGPTTADYEMVEMKDTSLQAMQPQHIIDGGQDVVKATKIDGKLVFTDKFLSAEIIVASFGLHNFENSKYSEKKSHAVFDHYSGRSRKRRCMQNPRFHALEETSLFEKVDKSFRANYSSLIGKPTREVYYIDCTGLHDPSDHKHLHGHRGSHPDILAGIMDAKDLQYVMAQVARCLRKHKDGKRMLVVTICKSGRHRSVGLKELVTYAFRKYIYCGADKIGAIDLQNQSDWMHMCCYKDGYPKRCPRCDYDRGYLASFDRKHWMYRSFYTKMAEEARRQKEA
jgi:hypothetical protein